MRFLALLIAVVPTCSMAEISHNSAPVQICKPTVIVKSCGSCCNHKPKIVYRTVEKPVEVIKLVDRPVVVRQEIVVEKQITKPNRVLLLAGVGPKGNLVEEYSTTHHIVSTENGPVMGLQYVRDIGRLSVTIQGQSNRTGLVGLGLNF